MMDLLDCIISSKSNATIRWLRSVTSIECFLRKLNITKTDLTPEEIELSVGAYRALNLFVSGVEDVEKVARMVGIPKFLAEMMKQFPRITYVYRSNLESLVMMQPHVSQLDGSIVECGVWAGGTCILLHYLFPEKTLYAVDSYEGCQDSSKGLYSAEYSNGRERHVLGMYQYEIEWVKENFRQFGIEEKKPRSGEFKNVEFIKGWVRDTLHPSKNPIGDIALLRIDVDSYSATKEILHYCYDKVVNRGIVVFDDAGLYEAHDAMKSFFRERKINPKLFHPTDWDIEFDLFESRLLPGGVFIEKE